MQENSHRCQITLSPADRQDGQRHGNRLGLIRAARLGNDELCTWLNNLRGKDIVDMREGQTSWRMMNFTSS